MIAILAAVGWKVLAGLGAVLAAGLFWWRSQATAKASGVAQQRAADAQQKGIDLANANKASAGVSALDDDAVNRELHAKYDRK